LQPTYRLLVGLAGASSGIEIARRFGFPQEIVQAASLHVSTSARDASEYLKRIKREAEEAESLRQALEEERAAVAEKYAALDVEARRRELKRQTEFERELLSAIEEFEKRSREMVSKIEDRAERARVEREAERRAAELKREAGRAARAATAAAAEQSRPRSSGGGNSGRNSGVRIMRDGRLVEAEPASHVDEEPTLRPAAPREIRKGDRVRLRSFGSIGIVDKINGDEAEVRVKSLRFREKLSNLELVEEAPAAPDTGRAARLKAAAARNTEVHLRADTGDPRAEINLIGRTTDEAVDETDKFLDAAYLNSLSHVRIIHGHGTGALRRAISDFLRNHPHVARYNQAPPDQGGAGATVVELKQ
jgi:DNA mismatch repair protein MutS2